MSKEKKLKAIVETFVEKHGISCPESIYQCDRVIEDACQLIEELCNVVGYKECEGEDE